MHWAFLIKIQTTQHDLLRFVGESGFAFIGSASDGRIKFCWSVKWRAPGHSSRTYARPKLTNHIYTHMQNAFAQANSNTRAHYTSMCVCVCRGVRLCLCLCLFLCLCHSRCSASLCRVGGGEGRGGTGERVVATQALPFAITNFRLILFVSCILLNLFFCAYLGLYVGKDVQVRVCYRMLVYVSD